jgi:hypothetical protein
MKEIYEITDLTLEELKQEVKTIKASGKTPFFHYTQRVAVIMQGSMIDEIIEDLYPLFDKTWHVGFLVPFNLKDAIIRDLEGYGI